MAEIALRTCIITCVVYLTVLNAQTLDCDFESDYCGWTHKNWTRSTTKSKSPGTGPTTGHTTSSQNYYIYLHAEHFKDNSGLVVSGQKIVLGSPDFNTSANGGCFRFWYHMQGLGIGDLNISLIEDSRTTPVWGWGKQKNDDWQCGTFPLDTEKTNLMIEIAAWTGPNVQGDIALDDLQYFSQQCDQLPNRCNISITTSAMPTQSTLTTGVTSAPVASPSQQDTTLGTVVSTTSEQVPDDSWILYVAIIPIIILVIGGIIAFAVYKLRKSSDKFISSPEPEPDDDDSAEEVYTELDENNMNANVDYGYTLSQSDIMPGVNNNQYIDRSSVQKDNGEMKNYLRMKNISKPKDEDTESTQSYIETVPGPIGNQHGQFNEGRGPTGVAGESVLNTEGPRAGVSNKAFVNDELHEKLSASGRLPGSDRDSPAPDYDGEEFNHPPPKCGPTGGYITAQHD